ncbi:MAG: hypothetical protein LKG25_09725 [Prevotella sp.]|jgi:predicted  nucleic acid-binding Zn-ribbon protein|nr:hypothetical protein [Prevotella sp.]MCI1282853.1 hypothetical protein [Prevotella sp.]
MDANEETLVLFTTRIRQLILRFKEMKKEKEDLSALLEERDSTIKKLEAQLTQAHNDYNSLKMARMIEVSDKDMENAQSRLSKLIRDVNKCMTLLSEK